jgi:DNA primase
MGTWIDFKKLREELDFEVVLAHYRVSLKRRGSQGTGRCPLPGHPQESTVPSFSVSFQKRIFQCFDGRCGAKGNVLDFVSLMERLDPKNPQEFRRAALIAQERFIGGAHVGNVAPPAKPAIQSPVAKPVLVNEPLDFTLKNLDTKPAYLLNRGFTEETIAHFGLGYCTKGTFAGRIVIPLHNLEGQLIGYAGRLVFDEAIDEQNPKYLFPSRREREGKVVEFAKSLFVYHGHAMTEKPLRDIVVVQGFPAAWWLWQHGYRDVVALMSATCTTDQAVEILKLTSRTARIWCFTDSDKAGEKCAHSLFTEIGQQRFCKWIRPEPSQPTDCNASVLADLLAWKIEK